MYSSKVHMLICSNINKFNEWNIIFDFFLHDCKHDCKFIRRNFVVVLSGEDDIRRKMVAMLSPSVYTQLLDFQLINNRVTLHVSKVSLGGEDWRWVLGRGISYMQYNYIVLSQYYMAVCTILLVRRAGWLLPFFILHKSPIEGEL